MNHYRHVALVKQIARWIGVLALIIGITPSQVATAQVVNEPGEQFDFDLSDNTCAICRQFDDDGNCTQLGGCTLVAAIQNANKSGDETTITFAIPVVEGPATFEMPVITTPVIMDGNLGTGRAHIMAHATLNHPNGLRVEGNGASGSQFKNLDISGFAHGIQFNNTSDGLVEGCVIHDNSGTGIVASGTTSKIWIGGATNTPGLPPGNIIHGNGRAISLSGGGSHSLQGNLIGFDEQGQASGNNSGVVIGIGAGEGTDIGGPFGNDRNIISNSQAAGITVSGTGFGNSEPVTGLRIWGNYIGTDATGQQAFGNRQGIVLGRSEGILVGGDGPGEGNLISGNGDGIWLNNNATEARVISNTIGLDVNGDPLPTSIDHPTVTGSGVVIRARAIDNVVEDNVISGNTGNGVLITKVNDLVPANNLVMSNIIGRDASGQEARGNQGHGILIEEATTTLIGFPGDENLIASNNGSGIVITGASAKENTFRRNQIFDNGLLDVDLGDDLITANDLGDLVTDIDTDDGPNGLLNFPVGVTGLQLPNMFRISGIVHTANPADIRVDVYATEQPNALGYGGGQTWLGEAVPNAGGVFSLDLNQAPAFPFLSALATDAEGNTSEFSPVCGDPDGDGNSDSDGDGLCDDWEGPDGIDYDGDGLSDLDLAALGAKPDHKDLFLEVDWMQDNAHSHEPDTVGLQMAVDMFAASLIDNPDGAPGVSLHILKDEPVREITPIQFDPGAVAGGSFDDLKLGNPVNPCGDADMDGHFGRKKEDRQSMRCAAILGARRLAYRYAIFGHDHVHSIGSSGIGENPGNDFMVTVGSWDNPTLLVYGGFQPNANAKLPEAKQRVEAATLVHEMGHTLNLGHGGVDSVNCKPNYPSVMSYALQFQDLIPVRALDYSRSRMPDLDENNLREVDGLGGPADRMVMYNRSQGRVGDPNNLDLARARTNQMPIDWDGRDRDGDGIRSNDLAISDVNYLAGWCGAPGLSELAGYDDWANLLYNFRVAGNFADGAPREIPDVPRAPELTPENIAERAENFDFDGDGFMNAFDNCSAIANPDQEDLDQDGLGDVCEASQADLGMHIEATPDPAALLEDLTYTAILYNLGPEDATNVIIAIAMDESMSFVPSASTGCTEMDRVIGCSAGNLAVGDSATVMAVVEPTEAKTLSVTATLSSAEVDPLPDNNSVVVETEVTTTVAVGDEPGVPAQFWLGSAYPNPFNPVATIPFDVAHPTRVRLTVFNVLGQQVRVLEDDILAAGRYERVFDAGGLPSGVYYFAITMGDFQDVGRMVLMK